MNPFDPDSFEGQVIQRLTRMETELTNHLKHHDKEDKFLKIVLPASGGIGWVGFIVYLLVQAGLLK